MACLIGTETRDASDARQRRGGISRAIVRRVPTRPGGGDPAAAVARHPSGAPARGVRRRRGDPYPGAAPRPPRSPPGGGPHRTGDRRRSGDPSGHGDPEGHAGRAEGR